jgi:cellulose biosynthesis protein BcsQ
VYVCWAAKGGVGTTVVAAGLAVAAARRRGAAVLVDSCGDAARLFGREPVPAEPAAALPIDGLRRLEVDVGSGLGVVTVPEALDPASLAAALAGETRAVVVDAALDARPGVRPSLVDAMVAAGATALLVTRCCYLALRAAHGASQHVDGVVVVTEPGRSLDASDVGDALGRPVVAEVPLDPAVARSVDAGVFAARAPRSLLRPQDRLW